MPQARPRSKSTRVAAPERRAQLVAADDLAGSRKQQPERARAG
jgi:hypothetical protein